ncbi:hypothetical protein YIM_08385 [Amycolatopsis sp. YIM 10]|nr:hypothetical protein YIM_08385 [Amycolatopsis sp. YIM 10]
MRAIRVSRFGSPEVLEPVELPTPEPAAGEVRVAGTVTAIGAGVGGDRLGRQVVTHAKGGYGGGYADTVISSPDYTFPLPSCLDPQAALAVLDDGSTALALEKTPVLVQLAVAEGAEVVAAVRGAEKAAVARRPGAETIDCPTAADRGGHGTAAGALAGHRPPGHRSAAADRRRRADPARRPYLSPHRGGHRTRRHRSAARHREATPSTSDTAPEPLSGPGRCVPVSERRGGTRSASPAPG